MFPAKHVDGAAETLLIVHDGAHGAGAVYVAVLVHVKSALKVAVTVHAAPLAV